VSLGIPHDVPSSLNRHCKLFAEAPDFPASTDASATATKSPSQA